MGTPIHAPLSPGQAEEAFVPRPASLDSVISRSPVLITGGSGGIGLALARGFRDQGATVHLVARNVAKLDAARGQVGAQATHSCDVTDPEAVMQLFRRLDEAGSLPGVVVNCAGSSVPGYFQEVDPEAFRATMESNYLGTLNVLRNAVSHMVTRGEGYILNVSSVAGFLGVYGMSTYSPAKFAVMGLSGALRSELKPHGIVVSVVCPPDTKTPMLDNEVLLRPPETEALSPSRNAITPELVARVSLRGLRRRRAVIVPGTLARFTWTATRFVPGLVERFMDHTIRKAQG